MEKQWQPCSDCIRNCHHNHNKSDSKHMLSFFKIMLGEFSKHLRIPPAFVKHFKHIEVTDKVILESPCGKLWHLTLERDSNGMFFQKGWMEFVKDQCLQFGDLLVFRFDGDLHFTLQIFDRTACEKECMVNIETGEGLTSFCEENQERNEVKEKPIQYLHVPHCKSCETREKIGNGGLHASENVDFTRLKQPQVSDNLYSNPKFRKILDEQGNQIECRTNAYEKAMSFKSNRPYVTLVMKRSHVKLGFYMGIPRTFIRNYRLQESRIMILSDPCKRRWPVNYVFDGKRGGFSGGWRCFSLKNNLKEGDVCIFELFEQNEFAVHICRLADKTKPLLCYKRRAAH